MVKWTLLSSEDALADWDANLIRFEDYSYTQTLSWGDYRGCFGWRPQRWAAFSENGEIVAMMQGLLRTYPGGFGIIWVPGGPVGNIRVCGPELREKILQTIGIKTLYCRINPTRIFSEIDSQVLKNQGWNRTWAPMLSGISMIYKTRNDEESRLRSCSQNWRHNLRRAQKQNLFISLWSHPDIDLMARIYTKLHEYKDIAIQFSRKDLENIFRTMGNQIVLYRCDDQTGEPVAFRGCALVGDKAWDLFAATTEQGRSLYASYLLFWKLIDHCMKAGVTAYDMGGVDPKKARGVYHFKRGTGAVEVEYLGEWEWASSKPVQLSVNCAIRYKGSKL